MENTEQFKKVREAHALLLSLGYHVMSSGTTSVVVRIGEKLVLVHHQDVEKFINAN